MVRTMHQSDPRHPLFQLEPPPKRLKFRNSFHRAVKPLDNKSHRDRIDTWSRHMQSILLTVSYGQPVSNHLLVLNAADTEGTIKIALPNVEWK